MKDYLHIPVLLSEVLHFLDIKPTGKYVDGTLGGGSYTREITKRLGADGKVLSIDLDPLAIENFKKFITSKNIVVNDNFSNIEEVVLEEFGEGVQFDGIVVDLGLSSAQLDDHERGFSFASQGPLDMSFGPKIENSTQWIVNNYKQQELENIIRVYGEDPWAKKIAQRIVEKRREQKITTAQELVEIINSVIPRKFWSTKISPATKTFQALRMETNAEVENLEIFLKKSLNLLSSGGRLLVVSFHSIEDRIVKRFFKEKSLSGEYRLLNKKPIIAQEEEVESNRRSRSAKLRVIEKI